MIRSCTLAAVILALALASPPAVASDDESLPRFIPGYSPHGLVDTGETNRRYVPPPPGLLDTALGRRVAQITVNYNPASCPQGTTTAWPADARTAFSYAASIWAAILNADRTIEVDACWRNDLPANTLGRAGPARLYRDFTDAPRSGTFYPVALANEYDGSDLNGSEAEINANFNSSFDWYFGTDGATPDTQSDFVTVVLHELGHGLGFTGSVSFDDGVAPAECGGTAGTACYGLDANNRPVIYDRFTEDLGGNGILSYTSGTTALGNVVTSDDVFFDGTSANILNGGNRVELFAPTTWNPGSSYAHLGEVFNDTEHALMTFSIGRGEAIHYPGRVTIGLFVDMGWDIRNTANVVVDASYTGSEETGGPTRPFDTVNEGVKAVYPGGTVTIRNGTYPEEVIVIRSMLLRAEGTGSSVIGGN